MFKRKEHSNKNRILIRRGLAVLSASLFCIGVYTIVKDDIQQKISMKQIEEYIPQEEDRNILDDIVNSKIANSSTETTKGTGYQDISNDIKQTTIKDNKNSINKVSTTVVSETSGVSIVSETTNLLSNTQERSLTEQVINMQNTYKDTIAWLYIPNTNIDYPIMQSYDNEYYLHRAVDGNYLYAGSVFMDYQCSPDFSDKVSIVYGHNMQNDTMFADVSNYDNENYFYNHKYGWITTASEVKLIEFFAVVKIQDTDMLYDWEYANSWNTSTVESIEENIEENEDWLTKLSNTAIILDNTVEINEDAQLVMLSTCWNGTNGERIVLVGEIIA